VNEPFGKDRAYVDGLTDRELYAWHFRKYDREADALEMIEHMEAEAAEQTLEQRRAEHLGLCRSFGFGDAEAEASWQEWLKGNGGT
jgi:hypothetical protein